MGACWTLPLAEDNIAVMETDLMIYKKWLRLNSAAEVELRVPENDFVSSQTFYQAAILHLSSAFERRPLPSKACECHAFC